MSLAQLFDPDSIAVIGASSSPGKIGYAALRNAATFDGPVHPINPNREGEEAFGREFVGSIEATDSVDLALICVPPPAVPDVIQSCGEADVGGAVIYSAGYSEAGERGVELEETITTIANDHGVSLLGPNTSGFVNPPAGVCASFVPHMESLEPGPLAIVAQSGGINHGLAFKADSDHRGISKAIGLGNRANVGFVEAIEYLAEDDHTEAIALHVEGSADARGLLEACHSVDIPVCAFKVGREDVDDFAASHTGSMTGEYALYEAGFRQYGVPMVDSTTEVIDVGNALAKTAPLEGKNVGLVSAQAGPGIVMTDRLKRAGARLPPLAAETQETIQEIVGEITFTENPVDTGRPMEDIDTVIRAVADDDRIDCVLAYELYEEGVPYPIEGLKTIAEEIDKPLLFATDGPWQHLEGELGELERAGIPAHVTPERGTDAVRGLIEHGRPSTGPATGRSPVSVDETPIERAVEEGRTRLLESEGKALLASAGIAVPEHELVDDPDAAGAAAERIGYPVVAKIASPAVEHKSDWGNGAGVALGLEDAGEVRSATDRILRAAADEGIDAQVYIEEAYDLDRGTELIIGGLRDPSFGPVVLVGLGGLYTEVFSDVSRRLAPIAGKEALAMIDELESATLLDGYRGHPAVDREAVGEAIATVSDILMSHDTIAEIEMNPVLAGPGTEIVALDALVALREE